MYRFDSFILLRLLLLSSSSMTFNLIQEEEGEGYVPGKGELLLRKGTVE